MVEGYFCTNYLVFFNFNMQDNSGVVKGELASDSSRIRRIECPRDLYMVVCELGQKVKIVYH